MHVELYAVRLALCGPGYVADIGAYLYRELSPLAKRRQPEQSPRYERHSVILISLTISTPPRGKPFWKLTKLIG